MIVLFPVVVAILCVVLVGVALLSRRGFLPPLDERVPSGVTLTVIATGLSLAAAAVHNAEGGPRLSQDATLGAAFVVMAVFQAGWGVLYLAMPSVGVAALGLVANDLIVLVWAWSRTVGLPLGPAGGVPEPVGLADATAALFEVVLIVLLAARLAPQVRPLLARPIRFGAAATVTTFSLLLIAAATGAAVSGIGLPG